jgi:ABC-type sugar transport system permease subunit
VRAAARWAGGCGHSYGTEQNATAALTDPIFWRVIENNALLLAAIPFAIGIPLAVAALLHEHVAGWRFFRSVHFLPTAVSWVVTGMVALFSLIFVMTGGGPGLGTATLEFSVYQSGFAQGQFGTGALYGIILFVIMIVVGLVQLRLIRSQDGEGW